MVRREGRERGEKKKDGSSLSNTRKARLLGEEREWAKREMKWERKGHVSGILGGWTCGLRCTGARSCGAAPSPSSASSTRRVKAGVSCLLTTWVEPRSHFDAVTWSHCRPRCARKPRRRRRLPSRGEPKRRRPRRLGEQFDNGALESGVL